MAVKERGVLCEVGSLALESESVAALPKEERPQL